MPGWTGSTGMPGQERLQFAVSAFWNPMVVGCVGERSASPQWRTVYLLALALQSYDTNTNTPPTCWGLKCPGKPRSTEHSRVSKSAWNGAGR